MSALSAATVRGAVALTAGTAGAAATLRAGFLVVFRAGFFAALRRVDEEDCFFRVVCELESIGAIASVARRTTVRALSLRCSISFGRMYGARQRQKMNTLVNANFTPSGRMFL
jgi:hypothetical protein